MSRNKKPAIIFGGYDAKSCPEKIRKNYDPIYSDIKKDLPTPADEFRMKRGVEREDNIKTIWDELLPGEIFFVDKCDRSDESKKHRENQTLVILNNPGQFKVIWNARLPQSFKSHRTGEPDALILHEFNKETGKSKWLPVDVKDHKVLENDAQAQGWKVSELSSPLYSQSEEKVFGNGTPQRVDALQLAHYYRMLEELGFATEIKIGGIIGKEGFILWHDLEKPFYRNSSLKKNVSALDYYDHEFNFRLDVAKNAIDGIALTQPIWKPECASCEFRTACHDELEFDMDHISLLAGMNSRIIQPYLDNGISRIRDLALLDYKTAKLVDEGLSVSKLLEEVKESGSEFKIDEHPSFKVLKSLKIQNQKDISKLCSTTALFAEKGLKNLPHMIDVAKVKLKGKVHLARNVSFVPIDRARIESDIDIEDSDGIVYLIGVQTTERVKSKTDYNIKSKYVAFESWSHSEVGEMRIFADFWKFITAQKEVAKANKVGFRIYHYSHHERTAFLRLADKYKGKQGIPTVEEVQLFMDSNEFIDMEPLIKDNLIWPTENHTLKTIAKWARFSWRDKDPGGGNSLAWYHDAVHHEDEDTRIENRTRIKEYNHDDVRAQLAIREWLTVLGEARILGSRVPNIEELEIKIPKKKK